MLPTEKRYELARLSARKKYELGLPPTMLLTRQRDLHNGME